MYRYRAWEAGHDNTIDLTRQHTVKHHERGWRAVYRHVGQRTKIETQDSSRRLNLTDIRLS